MMIISSFMVSCYAVDIGQDYDRQTQLDQTEMLTRGGRYSTKDEVARYIHIYKSLPSNFITKQEAKKLGWIPSKCNLWQVTDKKSIGGDIFTNRQNLLPNKSGRTWRECDINYNGGRRGPERLVYSNDGMIFYTSNHYLSFTRLY